MIEQRYARALAFLRDVVEGKRWKDNPWVPGLLGGPPMWCDERTWIVIDGGRVRSFWSRSR